MNKPVPVRTQTTTQPQCQLDDCHYWHGRDFPVQNDDTKGDEKGPDGLVAQSETQKSPRLNASNGNGPSVKGKEGEGFPTSDNGKESDDEQPVFAGSRDSSVGVNLKSGQIVSSENRLVPVPLPGQPKTIRANVKFTNAKGDIKENRI